MNAVRCTYIVCSMIEGLLLLALAIASPTWITPGYYWWTAVALLMVYANGYAFTTRMNGWEGMGKV